MAKRVLRALLVRLRRGSEGAPPAPARIGSDAQAILMDLGYAARDVERLEDTGIVGLTEWYRRSGGREAESAFGLFVASDGNRQRTPRRPVICPRRAPSLPVRRNGSSNEPRLPGPAALKTVGHRRAGRASAQVERPKDDSRHLVVGAEGVAAAAGRVNGRCGIALADEAATWSEAGRLAPAGRAAVG